MNIIMIMIITLWIGVEPDQKSRPDGPFRFYFDKKRKNPMAIQRVVQDKRNPPTKERRRRKKVKNPMAIQRVVQDKRRPPTKLRRP